MGIDFDIARLREDAVITGTAHRYDGWDLLEKVDNEFGEPEVVEVPYIEDVLCRPHRSYSGFHRWRMDLARAAGIDLEYEWRQYGLSATSTFLVRGVFAEELDLPYTFPDPTLEPLFLHSDCEGLLTVEECSLVAPRLRGLMTALEDPYDRQFCVELAEMMEAVIAEPSGRAVLLFC